MQTNPVIVKARRSVTFLNDIFPVVVVFFVSSLEVIFVLELAPTNIDSAVKVLLARKSNSGVNPINEILSLKSIN